MMLNVKGHYHGDLNFCLFKVCYNKHISLSFCELPLFHLSKCLNEQTCNFKGTFRFDINIYFIACIEWFWVAIVACGERYCIVD